MKKTVTYKDAGVDITAGNESVKKIGTLAKSTHTPDVMTEIGTFGALFDLGRVIQKYRCPVLVQSIDSVGTKLMVANMMGVHTSIGIDMVAHSCNDILCQGAEPLTFLDYIAVDKLDPSHVEQVITGIAEECGRSGTALIGGETAELPGVYARGEYDLVGAITGVVEKEKMILGRDIVPGDAIVGLASNGLHTNGYSLARRILFSGTYDVHSTVAELDGTIGEELLKPHRNYSMAVHDLLKRITVKGIAHITGGGLVENIPRILPESCSAVIHTDSWEIQPIFTLIQREGNVPEEDMFRTLNMGIGLILVMAPGETDTAIDFLHDVGFSSSIVGEITAGEKQVRWD